MSPAEHCYCRCCLTIDRLARWSRCARLGHWPAAKRDVLKTQRYADSSTQYSHRLHLTAAARIHAAFLLPLFLHSRTAPVHIASLASLTDVRQPPPLRRRLGAFLSHPSRELHLSIERPQACAVTTFDKDAKLVFKNVFCSASQLPSSRFPWKRSCHWVVLCGLDGPATTAAAAATTAAGRGTKAPGGSSTSTVVAAAPTVAAASTGPDLFLIHMLF